MSKSLKQEILDYVKSSKEVTLKDLYNKFDQTKNLLKNIKLNLIIG